MQSQEHLATHAKLAESEQEIARLQAQVEELQGDVSRLTIENENLKAQLGLNKDSEPMAMSDDLKSFGVGETIFNGVIMPDMKPTKKPRASKE